MPSKASMITLPDGIRVRKPRCGVRLFSSSPNAASRYEVRSSPIRSTRTARKRCTTRSSVIAVASAAGNDRRVQLLGGDSLGKVRGQEARGIGKRSGGRLGLMQVVASPAYDQAAA